MRKAALFTLNFIIFIALTAALAYLWWHLFGKSYIFSHEPVGGDYFNALTYVEFFKKYLPLPPNGWVDIWFEGMPIVGGYPWLSFYLIQPLTSYFDVATSMEMFSAFTLFLLFLGCFILLWQVSKNWLIAFSLTLVMVATRASYYALTTGGFIASFTSHFLLPFSLFFIYKFNEQNKVKYLIASGILIGISLLFHAPTAVLTVFLPVLAVLLFLPPITRNLKQKAKFIGIFLLVSITVGSMGFYNVFLQNFLGSGTDACMSPQCWGEYPKHLIVWMNALSPILIGLFLIFLIVIKLIRRSIKFPVKLVLPALSGLFVIFAYDLAAYLHLINGAANVFFPTRTFWAANLFLLLIAASLFRSFSIALLKTSYVLAMVTVLLVTYQVYNNFPSIHRYFSDTVPMDAHFYVIPKYKEKDIGELVPKEISPEEHNWRMDTFNPGLTHWWNFIYKIPSTRGYSNYPIGIHRDWVYFLQDATMNPKIKNGELVKNRALFVLDGFGVGFHENSFASYPETILKDPEVMTPYPGRYREFTWYKLSREKFTPIVYPSTSDALLFVGDDKGYQNFIRAIAMTNLNSLTFTPVKGPRTIDNLNLDDLANFQILFIYGAEGSNWSKIKDFVTAGGDVFIDTSSFDKPVSDLPEIFPIKSVNIEKTRGNWDATTSRENSLTSGINLKEFSAFEFLGNDWRLATTKKSEIRSWAKPILERNQAVLLVEGKLGKGSIVWSGINLPFHIVNNESLEEAKLLKNILTSFTSSKPINNNFKVERPTPGRIEIATSNIKGVYFKENYDSGWEAFAGQEKIKVYKAGMEFMYAPIPAKLQNNKSFNLVYKGSFINWFLFILTISAFILALLYILIPQPFQLIAKKISTMFKAKVGNKITTWIEEE